ncbi:MAG: hypothetical protein CM15mP13_3760 [Pseudomonadota bacterium]|nr:MAG: hypothetical protein CM15mP13_3760 [Pseudomonadota bacterium]
MKIYHFKNLPFIRNTIFFFLNAEIKHFLKKLKIFIHLKKKTGNGYEILKRKKILFMQVKNYPEALKINPKNKNLPSFKSIFKKGIK